MSMKTYSTMYRKNGLCRISEEGEATGGFEETSEEERDFDLNFGR